MPVNEVNNLARRTKKAHLKWFNQILRQYPGLSELKYQVHLKKGDPSNLIPQVVKKKKINLIVMGTLSRSGIEGLLIGNTAEKTLQEVDCSVMALKPDDFVSPVTSF